MSSALSCPQNCCVRDIVRDTFRGALNGPEIIRGAKLGRASRFRFGLWDEREGSDSNAPRLDHGDAPSHEFLLEPRKVGVEERDLVSRAVLAAVTEQHD